MGGRDPLEEVTDRPFAELGHRIQDLRRQRARENGGRYTQAQLADEIDVSVSTVLAWENGYRAPAEENRAPLARALGTTVDDLFASAGPAFTRAVVESFLDTIPGPHRRERQLEALEGFRRALAARGEVPSWWWEIKSARSL